MASALSALVCSRLAAAAGLRGCAPAAGDQGSYTCIGIPLMPEGFVAIGVACSAGVLRKAPGPATAADRCTSS